jgi:polygalacturonase
MRSASLAALSAAVLFIAPASLQAQTCPTASDVAIQRALDNAAAAGGGTVTLAAGVFETCQTLILGSNVHLQGAGRGATIIRGSAAVTGKIVDGAYLGTTIGGAGVSNVSVSDLTIDHRTLGRNANGISFVPTGSAYTGVVPMNVLVERVEVLGSPGGFHNYLIWNFKGQHVKIRDNWLDGGYDLPITAAPQEGIESFGGADVLISGNSVSAVGGACINAGSAGVPNSTTLGVTIDRNYLYGCNVGVNLGTSSDNGGQSNYESKITGNVILDATLYGIHVPIAAQTVERNLDISANMIRAVGPGPYAAGIRIGALAGAMVSNVRVSGNTVDSVTGVHGQGIRIDSAPNVRVLDNTIVGTSGDALVGYLANDLELSRNRVERSGGYAIYVGPIAQRVVVGENFLADWAPISPAIVLERVSYGAIQRNLFRRSDNALPPTIVDVGGCSMDMMGNQSLYRASAYNGSGLACQ